MTDLVPIEVQPTNALATVMGVEPEALMTYALKIANAVAPVLREQGMTQKFGPNEHVKAEGWQLVGSMMGFVADEGEVRELADGSYEAEAHLKHAGSGRVLTKASSRCGVDEATWKGKPKFNRRSMAMTRAISRTYAQNFRWIVKLAGFEGTPAEEMPEAQAAAPRQAPETFSGTDAQMERLEKYLANQSVPPSLWLQISERLDGQPMTLAVLNKAIAAARDANPAAGAFES